MRTVVFGWLLALALVMASPVIAAEEEPFQQSSFDLVEWVFGLLEIFKLEASSVEMGPAIDPDGEEESFDVEMGSGAEPNGKDGSTTAEMGPGLEPGG